MAHLITLSSTIGGPFPRHSPCYSRNAISAKTAGETKLPAGLREEMMPRHVAAIVDGNRRWARQKGLAPVEGYQAGFITMKNLAAMCTQWGVPVVSMFLFSSENWRRPQLEVDFLFDAFEEAFVDELDTFMRLGQKLSIIGDTSTLPISLQKLVRDAEEATRNNSKCQLLLAMSYSGQNDITQACQSIAAKVKDGLLKLEDITKPLIEQELQTNVTNIPCPDLLIRTSGESRISNYYLWQSAYTELYFPNVLWPDFGTEELIKALRSFQQIKGETLWPKLSFPPPTYARMSYLKPALRVEKGKGEYNCFGI